MPSSPLARSSRGHPPTKVGHPTARAAAAGQSPREPHDTAGIASIKANVATLPIQRTSMRMPLVAMTAPAASTATSRTRIRAAAHAGNAPRTTSAIRPAAIAARSATGSRTLPSSDTCPVRLAIVPSTQSVATTTPNSTMPHVVVSSSTISVQNTGIIAMRTAEMRLGTVRTREDDGVRSPDASIGRDGGT
jgi:hypothetical protein